MKTIGKFMMALMLSMSFSSILLSCGDDDDEQSPQGNNISNNKDGTDTVKTDKSGYYIIKTINKETRYPSGSIYNSTEVETPVYTVNSWLGKTVMTSYNGTSGKYEFTYSFPNNITCTRPYTKDKFVYSLDNGLVKKMDVGRESTTYEYDSRNRLTSATYQYGDAIETMTDTYTYDGYNMVEYKRTRDNDTLFYTKIEYTQIPAKTIPFQFFCDGLSGLFSIFDWTVMETGAFGNSIPVYLIKKIIDGETERVYEYEFDKNNNVIEMKETRYDVSSTFISTFQIEWEAVSRPSYTNWLFSDQGSPYYRYIK